MLLRTGEHVLHTQDTGSFLSKTFANLLVHVKRSFDKFVVRGGGFVVRGGEFVVRVDEFVARKEMNLW